jgi:hypothetical protein
LLLENRDLSNFEKCSRNNTASPGGTGFTGIYTACGEYKLKNVQIDFLGDGLNHFIDYGAALVTAGD